MYLSKNIAYLRKRDNLTQWDLVEKVNLNSRGTIAKWETGESNPDVYQVDMLADFFQVSIDDLFHKDMSKESGTELEKEVFNLMNSFLRGDIETLKHVDIQTLNKALIYQIKEVAAKVKVEEAIQLYIKAGDMGDLDSYYEAKRLIEKKIDFISEELQEEQLDEVIEYYEQLNYVKNKIQEMEIGFCDYMYLSKEEKKAYVNQIIGQRTCEKIQIEEYEENLRDELKECMERYHSFVDNNDFNNAKGIALFINEKLIPAIYNEKEREKYYIDLDKIGNTNE